MANSPEEKPDVERAPDVGTVQEDYEDQNAPVFQQLYNRVWLIALAGTLFFALTYVGWGLIDVLSAPVR